MRELDELIDKALNLKDDGYIPLVKEYPKKESINYKKCTCCNKDFYVAEPEFWVYKVQTKYFCSWTCFLNYKKDVLNNTSKKDLSNVDSTILKLREIRINRLITGTYLSECIGYSRGYVLNVESGNTSPSKKFIKAYAEYLDIDLKEIMNAG